MDENVSPALGMNRRELLKRGAIVGGTLAWAAPAVQTLARPALASTNGSPPGGTCPPGKTLRKFKYEFDEKKWESNAGGADSPGGGCTWTGWGSIPDGNVATSIESITFSNGNKTATIVFKDVCAVETATALVKTGVMDNFCVDNPIVTANQATKTLTVTNPGTQAISYVAFIICCC
jgi:hypothetical protein